MDAATMAADSQDRLFKMSEDISKVLVKVDNIEARLKDEHERITTVEDRQERSQDRMINEIKEVEKRLSFRLDNLDHKISDFKDDFEKRLGKINWTLGKYSAVAALIVSGIAAVIKSYFAR